MSGISSWLVSVLASLFAALILMCCSPAVIHWFLVPVVGCGIVIGVDAVDWIRGRLKPFDPAGVLGLLGFHVLFLCPILVGGRDHRLKYLADQPDDYRPWLGGIAVLTLFGILIYRYVVRLFSPVSSAQQDSTASTTWRICPRQFWFLLGLALAVSGALQLWTYYTLGGIQGYMNEYTNWLKGQDAFRGTALLFSISESFPILAFFGFAVWSRGARWRRSWLILAAVFVAYFILLLLFGGLRGSRSNTVWGLFWAIGILHFWIRPVSRSMILCGIPILIVFMSAYAVYKLRGADAISFVASSTTYSQIGNDTETPAEILLGDMGRSDVQAFLLYRLYGSEMRYDYALGRSYLGSLAMLVPKELWPSRPPTTLKWTTEAEYGVEAYDHGQIMSSRVYGLLGEAILNFGPAPAPLAFVLLGLVVARVRRALFTLRSHDSRVLLMPLLINFCFLLLINDSDNHVFFLMKYGLIPFLLIFLSSRRTAETARSTVRPPRLAYAYESSRY